MGKIVLVTIPIGDFEDISLKALRYLKEGKHFYVEDTRSFKKVLSQYDIGINDQLIDSFHDQSTPKKLDNIITKAKDHDLYIVSEAGSPYLSDPAYPLIKKAINENINIQTTGGINSVIYALELSGFPANPFSFHGFITRDSGARKTYLSEAFQFKGTHIFFEGVSRIENFLADLKIINSEAEVVIARELSKEYESLYRFKASDFQESFSKIVLKGEFVILVNNMNKLHNSDLINLAKAVIKDKGRKKTLAKLLTRILGISVKDIYAELGK